VSRLDGASGPADGAASPGRHGPGGTRVQTQGPGESIESGAPRQVGRYRLIRVIGVGGMGTVHLGRTPSGRPVAVKIVHPALAGNADFRARFRREIALARKVGGPFTAAVIDADPEHDPPWLATEYIQGLSLAEVIDAHGPLPEHSVRALAAGLSEALEVIHAAGIVHRDLKPSNVLLSSAGPRVIDFGVAKAVEGIDLTVDGRLLGTPGYMSPEHLSGRQLDARSDVFSLGAVLAFAASGIPPFGAGLTFAAAHRVIAEPPDLAGVPASLQSLVRRCVAKNPADRPDIATLLAEVGEFSALPPAEARSAGWLPDEVDAAILTGAMPAPPGPAAPPGPSVPGSHLAAWIVGLRPVVALADRFTRRITPAPVPPHRPPPGPQPAPLLRRESAQAVAARWADVRTWVHQATWDRLPPRTPRDVTRWTRWGVALAVLGLTDALAQAPGIRSLLSVGALTQPAGLEGAFTISARIQDWTGWMPDPVTEWIVHGTTAARIDARLLAVPLLLLVCLVVARRTAGRRTKVPPPPPPQYPVAWYPPAPYPGAPYPRQPYQGPPYRGAPYPPPPISIPDRARGNGLNPGSSPPNGSVGPIATVATWVATLLAVLLAVRYVQTGFESLLWATAALGWWTLLAVPVLAFTIRRLTGRPH
jgi:hypothetical protein